MYQPISIQQGKQVQKTQTFMASSGINKRDLPQLLDPKFAQEITNYLITTDGALIKRPGIVKLIEVAGNKSVTLLDKFSNDYYIFAYGNKLSAFKKSDNTEEVITTFSSDRTVSGARWGDYYFVADGVAKIARIGRTLAYNTQTANFTAGKKITGATSGATAIILEDSDGGVTGTLTLGSVSGAFQVGEIITDNNTSPGSATAGAMAWSYTSITAAPIAKTITTAGSRLYAGNLSDDETAVQYSNTDTGTNPPFNTWTTPGTLATDGGKVYFRNGGNVNKIVSIGNIIVVFAELGKWAFYTDTIDSAGTLKKVDRFVMDRLDFGGSRAAVSTSKGVFYVNEAGLWQLSSIGQANVPYSDQEQNVSLLLGEGYFKNIDLTNADITYDARQNIVLITCAKDSAANNLIIVYNLTFNSYSTFSGWNINRFLNDDQQIYLASSISTKLYKWDSLVYDDDGADIWTIYRQELKTGELDARQALVGQYIQGFLSLSTEIKVNYDIYTREGVFVPNKLSLKWVTQGSNNLSDGYGVASWGYSAWGGDIDIAGVVESFDGGKYKISNYQRIILNITCNDQLPHIINWTSLLTTYKAQIRRRKLEKLT